MAPPRPFDSYHIGLFPTLPGHSADMHTPWPFFSTGDEPSASPQGFESQWKQNDAQRNGKKLQPRRAEEGVPEEQCRLRFATQKHGAIDAKLYIDACVSAPLQGLARFFTGTDPQEIGAPVQNQGRWR